MFKKLKSNFLFPLQGLGIILLFMIASCQNSPKMTSGIDTNNLDTTVQAGADFYQFASGGWMKNNPLTDEYSRFGSFDKLAENNREQLKGLIEEIAAKPAANGSVEQKIKDLYNLAMDSVKLNSDGNNPIKAELQKLANIKTREELSTVIPEMLKSGLEAFFSVYVDADAMNSNQYLVQTYQGGISLGERDYYLENDAHTNEIREKYRNHVTKMFVLNDFDEETSKKATEAVLKIETNLAKAAYDQVKLRDPHANYNKMTVEELQKQIPEINWVNFFKTLGINDIKELNLSQKEAIQEAGRITAKEPVQDIIYYLQWKLIDGSASYLSDEIAAQNFDFYGKTLSGKKEQSPRWKRAVGNVDQVLGEAVGQMYVKKYFPAEAKTRMLKLVKNLQTSLGERIQQLSWMGDSTKVKAMEKLNTFHVKIGYPDKWRSYDALDIQKDSYWANIQRANRFESEYMFAKAGKEVDKEEWFMTPQTVNAYYNPSTNEICFPAGILQYPFFDMNADDAFNYGAIGVVIGHEMTHGFDDQGCKFDKDGNLKNWWTDEDKKQFDSRAQVLVNYFDKIEVAPGVFANGKFTLGENIADHGGLQVSFQAFKNATKNAPLNTIDGFTAEQRFFLAYSNVWAGNIRAEEILRRTKEDEHSLGRWRVNGALPHIDAWYEAFGITEKDAMFIPKEKRASIW
ncbi:MAG: M13 family peptidase [Bacteroidia bacterium]|nr:M13 family peptidase [Bacteroidia bacterium]